MSAGFANGVGSSQSYDIIIIGGGIVGLATALAVQQRWPRLRLAVLEKEAGFARHQTGHNSGVVHAGIYYRPQSLKAELSVRGAQQLREFCQRHQLRYEACGKVIVASHESQRTGLEQLYARGLANGVAGLRLVEVEELRRLEPYASGVAAIHSPNTAIVDYGEISQTMAALLRERGGSLHSNSRVTAIAETAEGLTLHSSSGRWHCRYLVNCAGLYADKIAALMGLAPKLKIVPFRGEYYLLKASRQHFVQGLIYPLPDPAFPFLGVHLTKTVHGAVEAGPNAVLAFAREGYSWGHVRLSELAETLAYPGFWKLAGRYWRTGAGEYYRSLVKRGFVEALRKLLPVLEPDDIVPAGAGVRAQAVSADGRLLDDFALTLTDKSLHVLNAPSPAATASLAIGEHIAARIPEI